MATTPQSLPWTHKDTRLLQNLRREMPDLPLEELARQYNKSNPQQPRTTNALRAKLREA
jgi:hypothetical protein